MKTILVLGGYGNFGKRIVESLSHMEELTVLVAGRSLYQATVCIGNLREFSTANMKPLEIDIFSDDFDAQLKAVSPYLVIHTSGPFQGQDYRVALACIECGAHYIDLADDRRFVCDISKLDARAKEKGVLLVSGASSVPGLSSAVVDHYRDQFAVIDSIDLAIAPGNKAERGLATVRAILSYTGHPFSVFQQGRWQDVYGWMDSRVKDFGGFVGKRHLANVDVPDLELFPDRYDLSERVSFQAGLELSVLHLTLVGMARMSKFGLVKSWAPMSKAIAGAGNLFLVFGSDKGAMEVMISGKDRNGKAREVKWSLYAPHGNGPHIPTLSAIILARKLLEDDGPGSGARPCVGLFELSDFKPYFGALDICFEEEWIEA